MHGEHAGGVLGAKYRPPARHGRLIELRFVEADGESLDPLASMSLQDRSEH